MRRRGNEFAMDDKVYMEQYILTYGFAQFEEQMNRLRDCWNLEDGRSLGGDAILLKRAVQHGQQQSNSTKEEQITFLLNFLRKTGEERMTQSTIRNEWQIFCRLYNELFSPVLALQAIAEVYGLDAEKLLKREYASANRENTGIYAKDFSALADTMNKTSHRK